MIFLLLLVPKRLVAWLVGWFVGWLVACLVAAALLAALVWAFRAYQDPAHAAQWLSLLQLCR